MNLGNEGQIVGFSDPGQMEPDEVFRCDRLRAVPGADQCLEMMIGGDDEVRICRDGAIGKGVVVRIAGDGVEAVARADVVDGAVEHINRGEETPDVFPSGGA